MRDGGRGKREGGLRIYESDNGQTNILVYLESDDNGYTLDNTRS